MSKHDWAYLLVAGFALWVIMDRFDRLARALHDLKIEVVKLSGDKERVQFLEQLKQQRNWGWPEVIAWVVGATVVGWLWFSAA
jgi:hypothetical protein